MSDGYLYGGVPVNAKPAAGVKGVLIRTIDRQILFRVYGEDGDFTDYEVRHDDLGVTIDVDKLASFYKVGERCVLDHSPEVLGLKRVEHK